MKAITINDVVKAVDGTLICGNGCDEITSITTDSREQGKDLFIALKGERFDANDFAEKYLEQGKSVIVSRRLDEKDGKNIIFVNDTNKALLALSGYYRSLFDIPVVAVTGSVGKTSTKEMLWSVISEEYNTLKTSGNFNNEIGVPLTLFSLEEAHQFAVVEMGMSGFGEMSRMTASVRPDVAVITNIGTAHIGNLGSQQNILKAKLEITEGMTKDGILVLNGDDELLWGLKGTLPQKTIYFGIDNMEADVVATDVVTKGLTSGFKIGGTQFTINAPGIHNIYNALCAYIIGRNFFIDEEKIVRGVANFKNCGMRQNIIDLNGITLIEDCYNASLDSVKASLKVLNDIAKGRTVAVLGDILEQGEFAEKIHTELGKAIAKEGIHLLIAVGKDTKHTAKQVKNAVAFENSEEAAEKIAHYILDGDTILVKGSRGIHLETVCEKIKELQN